MIRATSSPARSDSIGILAKNRFGLGSVGTRFLSSFSLFGSRFRPSADGFFSAIVDFYSIWSDSVAPYKQPIADVVQQPDIAVSDASVHTLFVVESRRVNIRGGQVRDQPLNCTVECRLVA